MEIKLFDLCSPVDFQLWLGCFLLLTMLGIFLTKSWSKQNTSNIIQVEFQDVRDGYGQTSFRSIQFNAFSHKKTLHFKSRNPFPTVSPCLISPLRVFGTWSGPRLAEIQEKLDARFEEILNRLDSQAEFLRETWRIRYLWWYLWCHQTFASWKIHDKTYKSRFVAGSNIYKSWILQQTVFDELIAKAIRFKPRMERVTSGLNTTMRTYVFLTLQHMSGVYQWKRGDHAWNGGTKAYSTGWCFDSSGWKEDVNWLFSGEWGHKCLEVIPMADSTNLIVFQQPSPTLSCQH